MKELRNNSAIDFNLSHALFYSTSQKQIMITYIIHIYILFFLILFVIFFFIIVVNTFLLHLLLIPHVFRPNLPLYCLEELR